MALVFKCLTDNIMLDDFKAVLQRLGAMKLDGSQTAMMQNSLNIIPHEKAGDVEDDADERIENLDGSGHSHRSRMSMSGRMLDDGEELDEEGRSRRRQSMSSSAVGKLGIKARHLRGFSFMKKSAEREAQRNMERNKNIPSMSPAPGVSPGRPSAEPDFGKAPTESQSKESFDFITSALDTTSGASR